MRSHKNLLAVLLFIGSSHCVYADEYPVKGAWAAVQPPSLDYSTTCESYFRHPMTPTGHVVVFDGSTRTELNGGYATIEFITNIKVRKSGPNEFLLTDRYFNDGEGGSRAGYKRRQYSIRVLTPDKIEEKVEGFPSYQYVRCIPAPKSAGNKFANPPASTSPTTPLNDEKQTANPPFNGVEPDLLFMTVDDWQISTARFGIGCIATYSYADNRVVSVGGERGDRLVLLVVADRKLFQESLDAEPYIEGVELVVGDMRTGNLRPYGYRGTPGVQVSIGAELERALLKADSIKLTEKGSLKLVVPLKNMQSMLEKLKLCFRASPDDLKKLLSAAKQVEKARTETWGESFQRQVRRCWKKTYDVTETPPEAVFKIRLKRDGTLEAEPVPDGTPSTPYLQLYRDGALQALVKCAPYSLPADHFDEWKFFTSVFTERKK
jgi:hypothetical protein